VRLPKVLFVVEPPVLDLIASSVDGGLVLVVDGLRSVAEAFVDRGIEGSAKSFPCTL